MVSLLIFRFFFLAICPSFSYMFFPQGTIPRQSKKEDSLIKQLLISGKSRGRGNVPAGEIVFLDEDRVKRTPKISTL